MESITAPLLVLLLLAVVIEISQFLEIVSQDASLRSSAKSGLATTEIDGAAVSSLLLLLRAVFGEVVRRIFLFHVVWNFHNILLLARVCLLIDNLYFGLNLVPELIIR